MPLPFLFVALAVGAGTVGTVKAVEGLDDLSTAKSIGKKAEKKYTSRVAKYQKIERKTEKSIEDLGRTRIEVSAHQMKDFIEQFRRLSKANQSALQALTRAGFTLEELKKMENISIKASKLLGTGVKALSSSTATYFGALGLTSVLASASTGTAISSLSGAAATNATLAWWGGGSIASGGGGMALGSTMVGVVAIGPALAIGGFMLASEGKKALKKARSYSADVDKACAKLSLACDGMKVIQARVNEIRGVIIELASRLGQATEKLKQLVDLRTEKAKRLFHQAALIAKALATVLNVQIIDSKGALTAASQKALSEGKRRL